MITPGTIGCPGKWPSKYGSEGLIIFSAINEDCVGDPPGELIINATAGAFLSENSLWLIEKN